jgi:hypothetical protein
MLRSEYVDDNTRIRHYSDENFKIRQIETDILYDDGVDVLPCKYHYEETDIPIDLEPEPDPDDDTSI